jgi:hypothetical protein
MDASKDAARLEWIMNNPDKLSKEFPQFVIKASSSELNACRAFVDEQLRKEEAKRITRISRDLFNYAMRLHQYQEDTHGKLETAP